MIILTLKTDDVTAEVGLYDNNQALSAIKWQAHRELADTLHTKIADILAAENRGIRDLGGIAVFKGPGSFTGLRIGISVANALAYSLGIPIAAGEGETWDQQAIKDLIKGVDQRLIVPEYGAAPHITQPKR